MLQVACHNSVASLDVLYEMCEQARDLCTGEFAVGRVIARPFIGEYPNFTRTSNRHDYSLLPPRPTMLNVFEDTKKKVISVGKIADIFANYGVDEGHRIEDNNQGMDVAIDMLNHDFEGNTQLAFVANKINLTQTNGSCSFCGTHRQ